MRYTFRGRVVGTRDARPPGTDVPAFQIEVDFNEYRDGPRSWLPYGLDPVDLGTRVTVTIEDES